MKNKYTFGIIKEIFIFLTNKFALGFKILNKCRRKQFLSPKRYKIDSRPWQALAYAQFLLLPNSLITCFHLKVFFECVPYNF